MYILLCGFPPFYGEDDDEIYDKICDGYFEYPSPYWDGISADGKSFCVIVFLSLNLSKMIIFQETTCGSKKYKSSVTQLFLNKVNSQRFDR